MQSVKVRRSGISADQAAAVLRTSLGGDYQVQSDGDGAILVHRGLARARVRLRAEPGGTVFDARGEGVTAFLLFSLTVKMMNERGIAKRMATVIGEARAFRDDR